MPKHENKQCPRCHQDFECKSGNILLCQCQTVALKSEHLAFIKEKFTDCLCAACLTDIRTIYESEQFSERLNTFLKLGWR